jgi:exodeoxyribonuclease VII small subunit
MKKSKSATFEETMGRIDEIVNLLESKSVSLEDSISYYEEAMKLIKNCHKIVESVEGRIKKIVNNSEMVDIDEK